MALILKIVRDNFIKGPYVEHSYQTCFTEVELLFAVYLILLNISAPC